MLWFSICLLCHPLLCISCLWANFKLFEEFYEICTATIEVHPHFKHLFNNRNDNFHDHEHAIWNGIPMNSVLLFHYTVIQLYSYLLNKCSSIGNSMPSVTFFSIENQSFPFQVLLVFVGILVKRCNKIISVSIALPNLLAQNVLGKILVHLLNLT